MQFIYYFEVSYFWMKISSFTITILAIISMLLLSACAALPGNPLPNDGTCDRAGGENEQNSPDDCKAATPPRDIAKAGLPQGGDAGIGDVEIYVKDEAGKPVNEAALAIYENLDMEKVEVWEVVTGCLAPNAGLITLTCRGNAQGNTPIQVNPNDVYSKDTGESIPEGTRLQDTPDTKTKLCKLAGFERYESATTNYWRSCKDNQFIKWTTSPLMVNPELIKSQGGGKFTTTLTAGYKFTFVATKETTAFRTGQKITETGMADKTIESGKNTVNITVQKFSNATTPSEGQAYTTGQRITGLVGANEYEGKQMEILVAGIRTVQNSPIGGGVNRSTVYTTFQLYETQASKLVDSVTLPSPLDLDPAKDPKYHLIGKDGKLALKTSVKILEVTDTSIRAKKVDPQQYPGTKYTLDKEQSTKEAGAKIVGAGKYSGNTLSLKFVENFLHWDSEFADLRYAPKLELYEQTGKLIAKYDRPESSIPPITKIMGKNLKDLLLDDSGKGIIENNVYMSEAVEAQKPGGKTYIELVIQAAPSEPASASSSPSAQPTLSGALVSANKDRVGIKDIFDKGKGPNGLNSDWEILAELTKSTKVKEFIFTHKNTTETWSTANPLNWPIVVYNEGDITQLNDKYGKVFQNATGNYKVRLYVQTHSTTFNGGTLTAILDDGGTRVNATIPASTIKPA